MCKVKRSKGAGLQEIKLYTSGSLQKRQTVPRYLAFKRKIILAYKPSMDPRMLTKSRKGRIPGAKPGESLLK